MTLRIGLMQKIRLLGLGILQDGPDPGGQTGNISVPSEIVPNKLYSDALHGLLTRKSDSLFLPPGAGVGNKLALFHMMLEATGYAGVGKRSFQTIQKTKGMMLLNIESVSPDLLPTAYPGKSIPARRKSLAPDNGWYSVGC